LRIAEGVGRESVPPEARHEAAIPRVQTRKNPERSLERGRRARAGEIALARVESRGALGIIVNPHSGRDARRLFARAGTSTVEDKRNQVTRIVVSAAAAGCGRVVISRDSFRIATAATDALDLPIEIEHLDVPTTGHARDGERAALAMRDAGCGAIVALGGDGTSRTITRAWRDAVLLPLSTGTNNVFPFQVEATVAGAAAGLVASGRLALEAAAERAKLIEVRCPDGRENLALIDAGFLVDDHPGSLLQVDPTKLARILLTRAEPASVGLSPIGGLLLPCQAEDDFGVCVETRPGPRGNSTQPTSHHAGPIARTGKTLRAPISPGLYEEVGIEGVERVELGQPLVWRGPGLLAFDGDRELVLAEGESATLSVVRTGPWVINPWRALRAAAERSLFLDLGHWHDHRGAAGGTCC